MNLPAAGTTEREVSRMYGWIFRHLPGPVWLKVFWALLLVAAVVFALFEWGYPWFNATFFDTTVTT